MLVYIYLIIFFLSTSSFGKILNNNKDSLENCVFNTPNGIIDLKSLSNESYSYQADGINYYFSICSVSTLCEKYLGITNVQSCQYSENLLDYELGSFLSGQYSIINGNSLVLSYNSTDHSTCQDSYQRSANFYFNCNPKQSFSVVSLTENPPCTYNFVIDSLSACVSPTPPPSPSPSPTSTPNPNPPGSLVPSDCIFPFGSQYIDLSNLVANDYSGYMYFDNSTDSEYYFNFCQPNQYCSSLFNYNTTLCQKQDGLEYLIAFTDSGRYQINENGLQLNFNSDNKLFCNGDSQKTLSFNMICNTSTEFLVSNFYSSSDECNIIIEIQSIYACIGENPSPSPTTTPSPTPTTTPSPSPTTTPSPTPSPTNTPSPTPSPTNTPSPTPMNTCIFPDYDYQYFDLNPLRNLIDLSYSSFEGTYYFSFCGGHSKCNSFMSNDKNVQSCLCSSDSSCIGIGSYSYGSYNITFEGIELFFQDYEHPVNGYPINSTYKLLCYTNEEFVVQSAYESPIGNYFFQIGTKLSCPYSSSSSLPTEYEYDVTIN